MYRSDIASTPLDRTIFLPELKVVSQRLMEKLADYNKRIEQYKESNRVEDLGVIIKPDSLLLDAIYKGAIVEALLADGKVDTATVREQLVARFKGYLAEDLFQNAVNVIDDYMRTGGGRTSGGGGFLDEKLFTSLIGETGILEFPGDSASRAWLTRKYHEYLGRNIAFEQSGETTVDLFALKQDRYKVRILEALRGRRVVDLHDLAKELQRDEGSSFDRFEFCNAIAAIRKLLQSADSHAID